MSEKIGEVTHYFTDLGVGIIELENKLEVGEKIRVKGSTTDFEQEVTSMEIDRDEVEEAEAGESIGMKVRERVREGDEVYKL